MQIWGLHWLRAYKNQLVRSWPEACVVDNMNRACSNLTQHCTGSDHRRPTGGLWAVVARGVRSALAPLSLIGAGLFAAPALADFEAELDLEQRGSGGLYLTAEVARGVDANFLLDTGASMVTVTRELISQARATGNAHRAGAIAARLANGKLQKMEVWELDHLWVGGCDVGPLEVAVVPKGRNILGLNALSRMAPFAIHLSPLKLAVSGCPIDGAPIAATF